MFFPTKTIKLLFYQFGQLFSSKKGQMDHDKDQKAKLAIYLIEVLSADVLLSKKAAKVLFFQIGQLLSWIKDRIDIKKSKKGQINLSEG